MKLNSGNEAGLRDTLVLAKRAIKLLNNLNQRDVHIARLDGLIRQLDAKGKSDDGLVKKQLTQEQLNSLAPGTSIRVKFFNDPEFYLATFSVSQDNQFFYAAYRDSRGELRHRRLSAFGINDGDNKAWLM